MFTVVLLSCLSLGLVFGARLPARIVNGEVTDTGVHPHQVSLHWAGNGGHVCGASIIANKWILTAAHCVEFDNYIAENFWIVVNNGKLDDPNAVRYNIEAIIHHENYDPAPGFLKPAFSNDIALIKLYTPISSTTHQPIELIDSGATLDGKTCTISGWGFTETGTHEKQTPNELQQTTGVILTKSQCESVWNTLLQPAYSHNVHICINDASSGSCNGDSGGPMVCDGKLAGVTSWGASGCDTTMPSVYVRVQNFVSWISSTIAANN